MADVALVLCGLWALLLFGVRSILQWRKTGSAGFNGFRGRVGSLEWFAGVMVSAGFVLTPLAPVVTMLDWPFGLQLFENRTVHLIGTALTVVGIAGSLLAQITMGDSWRIGVNPEERTDLITRGLYAWVRNPIFTFMFLSLIGFVLLIPNSLSVAALLLTVCGIELQVRLVEEPYLLATHGDHYRRWAGAVGRFFPGVGRGLG